MKILVQFEVNEKNLQEASGLNDTKEAIIQELRWLKDSGFTYIGYKVDNDS